MTWISSLLLMNATAWKVQLRVSCNAPSRFVWFDPGSLKLDKIVLNE
jgi:hypothetical protein